jgi:hypothetical protein
LSIENVADDLSSAFIALLECMGIDVQCGHCVRVAKSPADGAHGHASSEELGRVRMPKIVKANAGDSLSFADAAEGSRHVVGMEWPFAIDGSTEHVIESRSISASSSDRISAGGSG